MCRFVSDQKPNRICNANITFQCSLKMKRNFVNKNEKKLLARKERNNNKKKKL